MTKAIGKTWCRSCGGQILPGMSVHRLVNEFAHEECWQAVQPNSKTPIRRVGVTSETRIVMNHRTTNPMEGLGSLRYFFSSRRGGSYGKFGQLFVRGQPVRFVRVVGLTIRLVDPSSGIYWITQHCRMATPEETAEALRERDRRLEQQKALTTPVRCEEASL